MYLSRSISSKISGALLLALALVVATAHAQIDPASQIRWQNITGSGAPTVTCPSATILLGQPYVDTTNSKNYTCGPSGWFQNSGTGGGTSGLSSCADSSGSSTVQSCTTSPSFTPAAGQSCVVYTTTTSNSGSSLTVNVNSLGAKPVAKWLSTTTLTAGDVPANKPVVICYDGTNWDLSTVGNVPAGSGSGGQPKTCTQSQGGQLCSADPAYHMSNQGNVKTTVAGTWAPGTSGSVISCTSFQANQGVSIVGAGVSGATYFGTIVSCSGTTLTVTPATSTSVTSGGSCSPLGSETAGCVRHDEGAALQAMSNYLNTNAVSGNVLLNEGTYEFAGPCTNPSTFNSVLQLPTLAYFGPTSITMGLLGATNVHGASNQSPTSGTIIEIGALGCDFISGYDASSPYPNFTNVRLHSENIQWVFPSDPSFKIINGANVASVSVGHSSFQGNGGVCGSTPANGGYAIFMPDEFDDVWDNVYDVGMACIQNGVQATAHTDIDSLRTFRVTNPVIPDGNGDQNSIMISHLWTQYANCPIKEGSTATNLNVFDVDVELPVGSYGICNPNNRLYGHYWYNVPVAGGSFTRNSVNPQYTASDAHFHGYNMAFPSVALQDDQGGLNGVVNFYNNSSTPDVRLNHPASGVMGTSQSFSFPELGSSPSGLSAYSLAYALSSTHRLHFNMNNGTAYTFVGQQSAITAGHFKSGRGRPIRRRGRRCPIWVQRYVPDHRHKYERK